MNRQWEGEKKLKLKKVISKIGERNCNNFQGHINSPVQLNLSLKKVVKLSRKTTLYRAFTTVGYTTISWCEAWKEDLHKFIGKISVKEPKLKLWTVLKDQLEYQAKKGLPTSNREFFMPSTMWRPVEFFQAREIVILKDFKVKHAGINLTQFDFSTKTN